MTRRWNPIWLVLIALTASCSPKKEIPVASRIPYDEALSTKMIEFHKERVKRDPGGAIGFSMLAGAYLNRSREHDSVADAKEAEAAARHSLELRRKNNTAAATQLVSALLQQHRFNEAQAAAEDAVKIDPTDPGCGQALFETDLEVGDYDAAQAILHKDPTWFDGESGLAMRARFAELTGQRQQGIGLLKEAIKLIDKNIDVPVTTVAWFHTKLGQMEAAQGQIAEAQNEYQIAIANYPSDYRALGAMAKLQFAKGDWQKAIEWGERANRVAEMADIEALVGDSYQEVHDQVRSEKHYAMVEWLAATPTGGTNGIHEVAFTTSHGHTLDRQYATYCADHKKNLDNAYAAVLRDFGDRHDVYGFDALAWVSLMRGEISEARLAIEKSMSTGLKDATVFYHAGEIYKASAEHTKAATYFRKALEVNPDFQVKEARIAKAYLENTRVAQR